MNRVKFFKEVASRFDCIEDQQVVLENQGKYLENKLYGVRANTAFQEKIGKPAAPDLYKAEEAKLEMYDQLEALKDRQSQLEHLNKWTLSIIEKCRPEYRYYIWRVYVKRDKLGNPNLDGLNKTRRLAAKLTNELESVITDDDVAVVSEIIDEDLYPEDKEAIGIADNNVTFKELCSYYLLMNANEKKLLSAYETMNIEQRRKLCSMLGINTPESLDLYVFDSVMQGNLVMAYRAADDLTKQKVVDYLQESKTGKSATVVTAG